MIRSPYPPPIFWGGGVPVRVSWRGGGTPYLPTFIRMGYPPKVPKGAPPSRFQARVYVGEHIFRLLQFG
jgi:hypothetical protein